MNRRTKATLALGVLAAAAVALAVWLGLPAAREEVTTRARTGELCTSCHAMPEHAARHEQFACSDCHDDSEEHAESLSFAWLLGTESPSHGEVTSARCGTCHDAPSVPHGGHGGAQCATCHEGEHAEEEGPAPCTSCHASVDRHGVTAQTPCTSCHSFGGLRDEPVELEGPSVIRTAGLAVGLDPARVHGGMDCRRCHDPHEEQAAEVVCSECHRGSFAAEVDLATPGHQDCRGCHDPHASREEPAIDCLGCHVFPSAGEGWQTVPEGVPELLRAQATEVAHGGQCGSCHQPHTWVATEAGCLECHAENASPVHEGCTSSCHEPHSPQPTGAICRTCHEDVRHGAGLPNAHADCLSCHDAHGARPEPRAACGRCHETAHAQGTSGPASHRQCTSCHEEHGPPQAGATESCAGCHQAVAGLLTARAATVPAAHRCEGCHQPHRFEAGPPALARCASCHSAAVAEGASHRGSCEGCHQPHGAAGEPASACASCHAAVHPSVAGHQRCDGCHEPHTPALAASTTCRDCHGQVAATAARWPAASPHARECTACHATHRETSTTACASCHLPQSTAAHTGGHATCVGCHAPHAQPPPASWWDRCAGCHAEEAAGVVASEGTHGRCAACHQTPGPPLPRCQSCHQPMAQRLAHRAHSDIGCTTCHASHGPTDFGRSTCLGCHQDRTAHFPDAPQCQSCHPFGP